MKKDNIPGHLGNGRLLDMDWADTEMVKKWKYRYVSIYGDEYKNPLKIWPARPA